MASSPLPLKTVALRTAETLVVAAAGGVAFTLIGLPAGLVSGSLLSVGTVALLGRPVMIPRHLAQIIGVLVGISLGAVITPDTLKGLSAFPLSIGILLMGTLSMMLATMSYLRHVHGWDAQSALFGASPGALAQVMILASDYRADMRGIAIVQVMRVVALTLGIPTALHYFGLSAEGSFLPRTGPMTSAGEIAVLVAISTAFAVAVQKLRLPGGLMFGAMIGSGILHGGGFINALLPWWVAAAAVIGIGALTGSRFANTDPRTLLHYLGAALGSFAVAASTAVAFAALLLALLPLQAADVAVAFAPGAQDTMMVLALALHLDPIFIGAHHVARFLLVSISMPLLAGRIRQAGLAAKNPAIENTLAKQPAADHLATENPAPKSEVDPEVAAETSATPHGDRETIPAPRVARSAGD